MPVGRKRAMFLGPGVYVIEPLQLGSSNVSNCKTQLLTTGTTNPGKSPLGSRIKPLLELSLEALEHLFFDVFDIGEPAPTSDIAVLR
jgi:hypothetical protein